MGVKKEECLDEIAPEELLARAIQAGGSYACPRCKDACFYIIETEPLNGETVKKDVVNQAYKFKQSFRTGQSFCPEKTVDTPHP